MIGQNISHYRVVEKLGEGGMGVVYKAHDTKLDRTVALKVLPSHLGTDETEKQRFLNEAKAASSLDHPNICSIYSIEETEKHGTFIVMAYYEGVSLKEKIEDGPLSLKDAVQYSIQIATGLQEAHEKSIVHRDLKPANIFITNKVQIKIIDFGLAKAAQRSMLTKSGTTLGTVPYMSPEQAQGSKVDHRTDIWSLGVVMYEMLTGQLPFKSEYETALVYSIMNEDPEPVTGLRSGVPMELERIINKCLEKEQADRYQHADELIVDLRKVQRELSSGKRRIESIPEKKAESTLKEAEQDESGEEAIEWYRANEAENKSALANVLYRAERWNEAYSIYEELSLEEPDNIGYKGMNGVLAVMMGDEEVARQVEETLRNIDQEYLRGIHTTARGSMLCWVNGKKRCR